MQFLLAVLAALLPFSQLYRATAGWRSDPVLVQAVADGGAVTVQGIGRVNLLGIEAPRVGRSPARPAPFAIEARERLAALVLDRWVRLETDGERVVRGGAHHAAYVITGDGTFVNAVLVREGLARAAGHADVARFDELERAEREAQQARRGIWGGTPLIPPAGYTPPAKRSR